MNKKEGGMRTHEKYINYKNTCNIASTFLYMQPLPLNEMRTTYFIKVAPTKKAANYFGNFHVL
jgi:hypothetical protein